MYGDLVSYTIYIQWINGFTVDEILENLKQVESVLGDAVARNSKKPSITSKCTFIELKINRTIKRIDTSPENPKVR